MSRQSQYNHRRKRSVSPPWDAPSPMRPHRNKENAKGHKRERSRPRRLKSARQDRRGSLPIDHRRQSRQRSPSIDSDYGRYSPDSPSRHAPSDRHQRSKTGRYDRQTSSGTGTIRARQDAYNRREYKGHADYQAPYKNNNRGRHVSSPPGDRSRRYSRSYYDVQEGGRAQDLPDYGYNEWSGDNRNHKDYAHTDEYMAYMPGQYDRLPAEDWVKDKDTKRYLGEHDAKRWDNDQYNRPGSVQSRDSGSPPKRDQHRMSKNGALEEEIARRKALKTGKRPSFPSERNRSRADSLDDDLRALRRVDEDLQDVDYRRKPSFRVDSPPLDLDKSHAKPKGKAKPKADKGGGCHVM